MGVRRLEPEPMEDVHKRRISGVRETEEDHTRPTSPPPAGVTEHLIEATREESTAVATAPSLPSLPPLPADDFENLRELLQDERTDRDSSPFIDAFAPEDPFGGLIPVDDEDDEYGGLDPNAVPRLGQFAELGRLCLHSRAVIVLDLVDGEANVAQIVETSGMVVTEVIELLKMLVDHDAIAIYPR